MGIPANSSQRDIVTADLDRLLKRYPAMADLVELYRAIDRLQAEIAGSDGGVGVLPAEAPEPAPLSDHERMLLDAGQPLLMFDQLPIEPKQFASWVNAMENCLRQGGVQAEAGASRRLAPTELLGLAREGYERRAGPTDPPFAGSLAGLAVGLTLVGILRKAALARLPAFDPTLWYRGYCPICGGWPDLGLLDADKGARSLVCARCDAIWPYRRVGCPFCGDDEHIHYFAASDDKFRVYVCENCHTYLKHARLPIDDLARSLLGLRLLTVGLDLEAEAKGLKRPSPLS